MKKLLTILGAVVFSTSLTVPVVACGTSSSDNHKMYSKISWGNDAEEVIKLADGTVVHVGDLKKNSMDDYILDQVNKLVANKYAEDYSDTYINSSKDLNLGLTSLNQNYKFDDDFKDNSNKGFANEISDLNSASLASNIYSQYVSSLSVKSTVPLDEHLLTTQLGMKLNPVSYEGKATRDYSVWFKPTDGANKDKFVRWTALPEIEEGEIHTSVQNNRTMYMPTAKDLQSNNFYLVKDSDAPTGDVTRISKLDQIVQDNISSDKLVQSEISGSRALMYRFQKYLQKDKYSMINALTMEYAKNSMYKKQEAPVSGATSFESATNNSLYINTTSTIAKAFQSWPTSDIKTEINKVTSNFKMVWTVSVNNSTQANRDIIKKINQAINNGINTPAGKDYFSVPTTVKELLKTLTDNTGAAKVDSPSIDPFFGYSGYQGIVNADGDAVDGSTLTYSSDVKSKIKSVEGVGIIRNNQYANGEPTFDFARTNTNEQNISDFVVVMPLYLMDILRNGVDDSQQQEPKFEAKHNALQNIARDNWIKLAPQSSEDTWTSKDFDDKSLPTTDGVEMKKDSSDEWYIKISQSAANGSISLKTKDGATTIQLTPSDNSVKDLSGYGVKGVFYNNKEKADPMNGQMVNYNIHLGIDKSSPNSLINYWSKLKVKDFDTLTNQQKTELMNTLLGIIATKNQGSIVDETKNAIYRNYITKDDIMYQGLYDKLEKYLKVDDSTDESD